MSKRILTVDDSKTMRDMLGFALRGAGFEVVEAEDGQKALDALGDEPVDLIISDLNMPVMDGFTFIRHVRDNPVHRGTPIIVVTTEGDEEKKAKGREVGATGWLTKPVAPEKLLSVVRRVCG